MPTGIYNIISYCVLLEDFVPCAHFQVATGAPATDVITSIKVDNVTPSLIVLQILSSELPVILGVTKTCIICAKHAYS